MPYSRTENGDHDTVETETQEADIDVDGLYEEPCLTDDVLALSGKIKQVLSLCKKSTIHQLSTMLATSKNVLFPGNNHLLTTGTDDLTL